MRNIGFLLLLGLLGVPALAQAQNARMLSLLSAGKYAEAAKQYEQRWTSDKDDDDLFNAAFYYQRAGDAAKAQTLAKGYLAESKCREKGDATPRRVRHCALASELAGDLDGALKMFKKYRDVARLWVHRSRADGGIDRVQLKQRMAALEAENAKLKANCPTKTVP